ncbi:hypothetical protein [Kitasatospora sp. NPDC059327]|uniref:hypothetical protein n=1 Tax=Kitasatospora sp. NPDC059327 TaxID=3346803 RepID=UPI0036ADBB72
MSDRHDQRLYINGVLTRAENRAATGQAQAARAEHQYLLDTIALAARTVPIHLDPDGVAAVQRGEGATLSKECAAEIARVVLDSLHALDPPGHHRAT